MNRYLNIILLIVLIKCVLETTDFLSLKLLFPSICIWYLNFQTEFLKE